MADNSSVLEKYYELRENFQIIALTGLNGSGCTQLANMMCDKKELLAQARHPEHINVCPTKERNNEELFNRGISNDISIHSAVFKEKYAVCYNFFKENYHEYKKISYLKVAWLYTLLYAKSKSDNFDKDILKSYLLELLADKYFASHKDNQDVEYKKWKGEKLDPMPQVRTTLAEMDFAPVVAEINNIWTGKILKYSPNETKNIAKVFFDQDSAFNQFIHSLSQKLVKIDFYYFCFFYHRLTTCIRVCGNPFVKSVDLADEKVEHLYDIVALIKILIKGLKYINEEGNEKGCRVVIDSLRNSMEAKYLNERYSAFYLVAVHSDTREENLKAKIRAKTGALYTERDLRVVVKTIMQTSDIEASNGDFEDGKVASPNTEQCIADAEIHISNIPKENVKDNYQYQNMAEQWMKYASLILHPGLITPSSAERCMIVAYTAKLNSACLSRQVGAVITNSQHAIRTIGWNDVPYGQMPCSLRDVCAHIENKKDTYGMYYSDFEMSSQGHYEHGTKSFRQSIQDDYRKLRPDYRAVMKGLPMPYCFKTLENRYSGEKNQVFTRSLHAEENAMLQMVKYGGQALENGVIYVTASPCELCSKKLYQIGVRRIVYIDAYPGIAREHIVENGSKRPNLVHYQGAYGATYFKLYTPFMAYKDELSIRTNSYHEYKSSDKLLGEILKELELGDMQKNYTKEEYLEILERVKNLKDSKENQ